MMKNGNISDFGKPQENELEAINKYTRRKFTAEELYAFSVVLCDNEVDRDFERFTDDALEGLAKLFLGKTGIFDHSHKAENQCARVFYTEVKSVDGVKNQKGEQYKQLFARAYMPKSALSDDLILSIESGIKKEVSVGCSMGESYCSVCGKPMGVCQHKKGKFYTKNGTKNLCFFELSDPKDAYEWSFVAVPAQPAAGVVKAYKNSKTDKFFDIEKCLVDGEIILTEAEIENISKQFENLKATAEAAGEFLERRKMSIVKMFLPNATEAAEDMFLKALNKLSPDELFNLYKEGKANSTLVEVQLKSKNIKQTKKSNSYFMV